MGSVCLLAEQWGKNALSSEVGGHWSTCSSPQLRCQVLGLWHRKAQSLYKGSKMEISKNRSPGIQQQRGFVLAWIWALESEG